MYTVHTFAAVCFLSFACCKTECNEFYDLHVAKCFQVRSNLCWDILTAWAAGFFDQHCNWMGKKKIQQQHQQKKIFILFQSEKYAPHASINKELLAMIFIQLVFIWILHLKRPINKESRGLTKSIKCTHKLHWKLCECVNRFHGTPFFNARRKKRSDLRLLWFYCFGGIRHFRNRI